MGDILDEIVAHKQKEIEKFKEELPLVFLESRVEILHRSEVVSMKLALTNATTGIIAEVKRKSPSKGWIARNFGGSNAHIRMARQEKVYIPILYKNFIIDEYQLYQAKVCGASAVLLIAACLSKEKCRDLINKAHELNLEVLLEMHTEEETEYAELEPDMCGINNRNLGTFITDVNNSLNLIERLPAEAVKVSESGISDIDTIRQLKAVGYQGFLIGSILISTMIIKVCGMRDAVNIQAVEQLGIDWMGMIFWPKSSRYVADVPTYQPKQIRRVGVFVDASLEYIRQHVSDYQLDLIQLHGHETPAFAEALKPLSVIKAFNIADVKDLNQTKAYEGIVDYFLFDTKGKVVGGNGEKFDWSVLSSYHGETPFLLSGGIGPDDVEVVNSFHHSKCIGIDLNSRFEQAPALKDITKLSNFLKQLHHE